MLGTEYRRTLAGMAAIAGVILLSGCTATTKDASPSPSSSNATTESPAAPAPTTAATDDSTPSASAAPVSFPTDCKALVAGSSSTLFATTPLNDPTVVGSPPRTVATALTPALVSGGKTLSCTWKDPRADISGLSIDVMEVSPQTAATALASLPSEGFVCSDVLSGTQCQKISRDTQYPVDIGDTYFVRGTVGFRIYQANVPTSGLLADVVGTVF